MNHLDILIPFGLPPSEMSIDLLRELKAPALPHETWLARRFGLGAGPIADNSPPLAAAAMQSFGLAPDGGAWFVLQPVHFFIARDHLVLTDTRQLELPEQESRILFDIAKPLFEEDGKALLFGNASAWFVRADDWKQLRTSTPDAACGHNIDIWMPRGEGERNWRKVQNEVQMHWFAHSINAGREARGLKPVNSIWLWGGSSAAGDQVRSPYSATYRLSGWASALGRYANQSVPNASAGDIIAARPEHGLVLLDELVEPALANDWSQWLDNFRKLEKEWFTPYLDALQSGKVDRLSLVFTHNSHLSVFNASRLSLRKFWIKPSLSRLCP